VVHQATPAPVRAVPAVPAAVVIVTTTVMTTMTARMINVLFMMDCVYLLPIIATTETNARLILVSMENAPMYMIIHATSPKNAFARMENRPLAPNVPTVP